MENFTITTLLTTREYAKTFFIGAYRRPLVIIMAILGLLQFCIADYNMGSLPTEFFVGLFLLLYPALITLIAVKQFKSNRACQGIIEYTFSESGVAIQGETYKTEFVWAHILKLKEIGKFLVLLQSKQLGSFIDKTKLTEEQFAFIKNKVSHK